MSLVTNINDVSFYSGHAIDKIVRVYTGTYNSATDLTARVGDIDTAYVYRIPHNIGRPMFCELITSLDGGTTYTDGGLDRLVFCDADYIYIFNSLSAPGTDVVTYKVWCSWIDNYDTTNPAIDVQNYNSLPTQFDSRVNYQKVYDQNVLDYSAGTFGSTQTQSIIHPLGYVPNAKVFFEAFPNEVWTLNAGGASNPYNYSSTQDECTLEIYTDRIDVKMFRYSNTAKRAWYRIFYDEG